MNKTTFLKKLLALLLLILSLAGSAQTLSDYQKNEDFQRKLQKFRYSLYAGLMPQQDSLIYHLEDILADTNNLICKKTRQFQRENLSSIQASQLFELQKCTSVELDLSQCIPDTSFNAIISDSLGWAWYAKAYSSFSLLAYSPISIAFTFNTLMLNRLKTPTEIGSTAMLNNIASPLVKTRLMHNQNWEIMIDTWEYVFVYEYKLPDNTLKAVKVLKRVFQ